MHEKDKLRMKIMLSNWFIRECKSSFDGVSRAWM